MIVSWYFLASGLFLKHLPVSHRIWAVWGQGPHLLCSELSKPPSSPLPPCPIAHSWYAKYISWIKEIKLYQHYPDWHRNLPWILPTVTAGKESVSLIAWWMFTDRMFSQTCRKKKAEESISSVKLAMTWEFCLLGGVNLLGVSWLLIKNIYTYLSGFPHLIYLPLLSLWICLGAHSHELWCESWPYLTFPGALCILGKGFQDH